MKHVDTDDTDTEIVVVSDTVRLRRARTPSNSDRAMNLPDLLPNTFRLAEESSLFSNMDRDSKAHLPVSTPHVSHIKLENVQYFEPEHAETVHILDLSEDNASDASGGTPKRSQENISVHLNVDPRHGKIGGKVEKELIDRINSFYESEEIDEPLIFSEDDDDGDAFDNGFGANLVQTLSFLQDPIYKLVFLLILGAD